MTSEYIDGNLNIYGSTLSGSFAEPLGGLNFRILSSAAGKVTWELTLDENRGPQAQSDRLEKSYAGWSSSTADARFRGYVINPLKLSSYTLGSGASSDGGSLFGTNFDTTFVMAQGSTANSSLWKETSTTDPTPSAVTYSPGAQIMCLLSGPLNSTNSVIIGRSGTTTDVHTTLGTSAATMHTDLNGMVGGALSSVNSTNPGVPVWIFKTNTGLFTLASNVAANTQPTSVATVLPTGGTVFGFETLEKSPFGTRMYFIGSTNGRNKLLHCNAEGTDILDIPLSLSTLNGGRLWQRNFVGHDLVRITRFDGERETDLNIFSNIAADSDKKLAVLGLGGSDASLRALVQTWDLNTAASSTLQWWEYMAPTNSWLPVSATFTPYNPTTVSDGAFYLNGLLNVTSGQYNFPYSKQTGACYVKMHKTNDEAFAYQLVNPQGINPFNAYRKTGSSDNASKAFETSSVHTRPAWIPPGKLAGHPFEINQVDGRLMDIEAGGSDATVKFEIAMHSSTSQALSFTNTPLSVTFSAGQGVKGRVYNPPAGTRLHRLQVRETLTQGTGETNKTPNGAYAVIRGTSYVTE